MLRTILLATLFWFTAIQLLFSAPFQVDATSKANRYYEILRKRPNGGYLFDRFVIGWLDESSIENLEQKLVDAVEESKDTNDRLLLAFFYSKQGEDSKALVQFREALKNDPGNAEVLYEKAVVEARTLDFEKALADLAIASKSNPKQDVSNKIAQLRGKLYVRNRQNDEAIKIWHQLLGDNPDDDYLAEEVIELQLQEGLYKEAETLTDKLIARTKDPFKKVMRQLRKGDIVQRSGRRKQALEIYEQSLSQVGADTWLEREILGQVETLFRREDDLTGLNDHYKAMIKKDAKRLAIRKASARIKLELGLIDEALQEYKNIVEMTPGDRRNVEAYISALVKNEELELAIRQLESLVQQNKDDGELRLKLAKLYHSSNPETTNEKIATTLDKFVEINNQSEYAYLRVARLFDQFEDASNTSRIYEVCLSKYPESATAQESWADYLYRSGQKEKAITIWKELGKGDDAQRLVRVARIMSSRQEHQAAFEMLESEYEKYKLNPSFLGQLCTEAISLKKIEQAVPWVLSRVRFAQSSLELDVCLAQAVQVISKSEQFDQVRQQLLKDSKRRVSTTCLLAELFELAGESQKADDILASTLQQIAGEKSGFQQNQQMRQQSQHMLASQQIRLFVSRQEWDKAAQAAKDRLDMPGGRKTNNVRQLIDYLLRDGQLEVALKWVEDWKKISPGSILPWTNEASILDRMGKLDEAILALRQATRKFPEDIDLHWQLAERYRNKGQYNEAERIYWKQFESSQKLGDKLRWSEQLAEAADEQGNIESLVNKIEERRRSNPQSIEPLLALAQVHRVADNYEERRTALLEATRLQKDNLGLLQEIARLEEREGDWQNAIETLQKAEPLDKTNRTRQRIATLYIQFDDAAKGYSMLFESLGGANADPREVEKIAVAIIENEEWDFAQQFITEYAGRFPDDFRIQYLFAIIQEQAEAYDDAADILLTLLNSQKEITGLKATSNPFLSQMESVRKMLPPEAYELLIAGVQESSAYSYLEDYNRFGFSIGMMSGNNWLPNTPEECRQLSIAHLRTIAANFDKEKRESLKQSIKVAGIANHEILMEEEFNIQTVNGGRLYEKYPDNKAAMALSCMAGMDEQPIPADIAISNYRNFKADYPELAFCFSLQAAAQGVAHHALLDSELANADQLDANDMMVAMLARYLATGGPFPELDNEFTDQQKTDLGRLLREWYPRTKNSQMSGWAFSMVANALKNNPDAAPFIGLLDEEILRSKQNGGKSTIPMYSSMSGRSESMVQMISFPPKQLSSVPPTIVGQLGFSSSSDRFDPFSEFSDVGVIDPEAWHKKYQAVKDQVKDPILKVLLEIRLAQTNPEGGKLPEEQQYESVTNLLEDLKTQDQPNPDAFLLSAGLAIELGQIQKASDELEKMRNLPLKRDVRTTVDKGLVAIALQELVGDMKADKNKSIVASAKAAALRLRRGRLDAEQRTQLVTVFSDLGLNEEADKMEKKIAGQGIMNRLGGLFGGSAPTRSQPVERIRDLVDNGKTESAARLLASEFKGVARSAFDPNGFGYNDYEAAELETKIKRFELVDAFIEQIKPGESQTLTRLGNYAYALEVVGRDKEAIEAYNKVLNKKQSVGARLRLLRLQMKENQAIDLTNFSEKDFSQAGNGLVTLLENPELPTESLARLADAIITYAGSPSDGKTSRAWLSNAIQTFGQAKNRDNDLLPSLYSKKQPAKNESETKKSGPDFFEIQNKIRERHDLLCRTLLSDPENGPSAFTALLRSREANQKLDEDQKIEFLDTAIAVIVNKETRKVSGPISYSSSFYQNSYGYDSAGPQKMVEPQTPVEFLASTIGLLDSTQRDRWQKEVTERLTAAGKDDSAKAFSDQLWLFTSSDQQFETIARNLLNQIETKRRPDPDSVTLVKIIDIWDTTKRNIFIDDLILEKALAEKSRSPRNYYAGSGIEAFASYAERVTQRFGIERAETLIDRYLKEAIGDQAELESLQKLISEMSRSRNSMSARTMAKVAKVSTFFRSLSSNKSTALLAIKKSHELGFGSMNQQISRQVGQQFREFESANELMDWINEATPFLQDVESFDPYVNPDGKSTILAELYDALEYQSNPWNEELVSILSDKKSLSFGEQFLLEVAKDSYDLSQQAMLALQKHLDKVQQLPEEKQKRIAIFVKGLSSRSRNYPQVSNKTKPARDFVANLLSESFESEFVEFMNAKRLSDLNIEEYAYSELAKSILSRLGPADIEKWQTTYEHALKLAKSSSRNRGPFGDESLANELADSLVEGNTDFNSFKILEKLIEDENNEQVALGYSKKSALASFLNTQLVQSSSENEFKDNDVARFDGFYRTIGAQLDGVDTTPFVPVFADLFFKGFDDSQSVKVTQWAELEAKNGKYAAVAKDLLASLYLADMSRISRQQQSSRSKGNFVPKTDRNLKASDSQQLFVGILDDPDLGQVSKATIIQYWLSVDQSLPAEYVWKAVEIGQEALATDYPLSSELETTLLTSINLLEDSPEFKEKATIFSNVVLRNMQKQRGGRQYFSYDSRTVQVVESIKLFARIDARAKVERIIRSIRNGASRRVVLTLINRKMPELAKSVTQDIWSQSSSQSFQYYRNYDQDPLDEVFSAETENNIEAFVKVFNKPDEKLLAEAFIAGLPDSKDPDNQPTIAREDRLKLLAEQYLQTEFLSKSRRQRCLLLLVNNYDPPEAVANELHEIADKLGPENLFDDNNSNAYKVQQKMFAESIAMRVRQGMLEKAIEKLNELISYEPKSSSWAYEQMVDGVMSQIAANFKQKIIESKSQDIVALLPALRNIFTEQRGFRGSKMQEVTLIAHIVAQKSDELRTWMESIEIPDGQKESDEPYQPFGDCNTDSLWPSLQEFAEKNDRYQQSDDRFELVKETWKLAAESGLDVGTGHFQSGIQESCDGCRDGKFGIQAITESKLLTELQIADLGGELAEIESVDGEIWRQVAKAQVANQKLEKAVESMKAAVEATDKEQGQALMNRKVEFADILMSLDRKEEARQQLTDIDTSLLLGKNPLTYNRLTTKLK